MNEKRATIWSNGLIVSDCRTFFAIIYAFLCVVTLVKSQLASAESIATDEEYYSDQSVQGKSPNDLEKCAKNVSESLLSDLKNNTKGSLEERHLKVTEILVRVKCKALQDGMDTSEFEYIIHKAVRDAHAQIYGSSN